MSNNLNITMDQGSTLVYTFNLTNTTGQPLSLTGFDARLQVRKSYGATAVEINCTIANGKLSWGTVGQVILTLTPADTSSIRFASKDDAELVCVYDLEIIDGAGKVYKPARGDFTLNREVTR
jgi:hypothetical protein